MENNNKETNHNNDSLESKIKNSDTIKVISDEEAKENLIKKYTPKKTKKPKIAQKIDDVCYDGSGSPIDEQETASDILKGKLESFLKEELDVFNEMKTPTKEDSEELTEDDIQEVINKINIQIAKLNAEFYSLIKEEEEIPVQEVKIKVSKPKTIKIPKETFKQIKAHCKEHNVNVEDWIERITLNEINRIIIRLGDL